MACMCVRLSFPLALDYHYCFVRWQMSQACTAESSLPRDADAAVHCRADGVLMRRCYTIFLTSTHEFPEYIATQRTITVNQLSSARPPLYR
jgi:hypothetical protein